MKTIKAKIMKKISIKYNNNINNKGNKNNEAISVKYNDKLDNKKNKNKKVNTENNNNSKKSDAEIGNDRNIKAKYESNNKKDKYKEERGNIRKRIKSIQEEANNILKEMEVITNKLKNNEKDLKEINNITETMKQNSDSLSVNFNIVYNNVLAHKCVIHGLEQILKQEPTLNNESKKLIKQYIDKYKQVLTLYKKCCEFY